MIFSYRTIRFSVREATMHEILIIGVKIVSDNFAARFEHNGKIGRELDTVNRADTVNR